MAGYKISASVLNRRKAPGKMADGLALSFKRNKDGTLSAIQRVKSADGKESDVTVSILFGEITQERLTQIRAEAYALKVAAGQDAPRKAITFADAWESFRARMAGAANSKWSPATLDQATGRMLNHVAGSVIWDMPVSEITAALILETMESVRENRPKLAPKVLSLIGQVLASVTSAEGLLSNQARLLKSELKATEKNVSFDKLPAITDLAGIGRLICAIENSSLYLTTRVALLLQAYTAQRSGEVAGARRAEFEFTADGVTWTIPRARMKVSDWERKPFDQVLILPASVADLVRRLPDDTEYLFPPRHGQSDHITVEGFSAAFQRLGFRGVAVPHGWRSSLKTLAEDAADGDERPLFSAAWVEAVLDHAPPGVAAHYQRGKLEKGMARVLAWWAQQLDQSIKLHRGRPIAVP